MVDETTIISNIEQLVCLRWVDHEEFVELCFIPSISAAVLASTNKDNLRLDIFIDHCRGQCYGGASAMAGRNTGVATVLKQSEPRCQYAIATDCHGVS